MSQSGQLAIFIVTYGGACALLHWVTYRAVGPWFPGPRYARARALSAFDLASVVQFLAWIPFGLGALGLGPLVLFTLPTVHELYDLAYVLGFHARRFNGRYRRFVLGHHLTSLLSRIAGGLLI